MWKKVEPEEEDEMIEEAVELIFKHGLETIAILVLQTAKPMCYIGGEFGRFFLAPLIPIMGHKGDIFLTTFEKRENLEKIIKKIEERIELEEEKKIEKKTDSGEINNAHARTSDNTKGNIIKYIILRLKNFIFRSHNN